MRIWQGRQRQDWNICAQAQRQAAGLRIYMRQNSVLNPPDPGVGLLGGYERDDIQISRFGATSGGHLGDQDTDHNGGSARVLPDHPYRSA